MTFEIFDSTNPKWSEIFLNFDIEEQDVFYSAEYAQASKATIDSHHRVLCASQQTDTSSFLYPFIQRDINQIVPEGIAQGWFDVVSLYGRGGIVGSYKNSSDLLKFHDEFTYYARENQIVCGFDRLHPILENHRIAPKNSKVFNVGNFVVIDLRPTIDDIFATFKHRQRKAIRKAINNNITTFDESDLTHLDHFLEIYHSTLSRQNALDYYYFEKQFYQTLMQLGQDSFKFFYASLDNNIISCELVLYGGKYCHSFFGGTLKEFLHLHILRTQ